MIINRRDFIHTGVLTSASLMLPKFLKALDTTGAVPPGNKVLVVVQFSGGNDGLNTVIPVSNDIYYQLRPHIGIKKNDAVLLNNDVGLNPSLFSLKNLYDEGSLGILNSVGYPNPDRSHFRSMDIWQSASDSKDYVNTGWLGRYLDAQCPHCDKPTNILEIDDVLSLALRGNELSGIAFRDPGRLYSSSHEKYYQDINTRHQQGGDSASDYLYKVMSNTLNSADYIFKMSRLHPSHQSYPDTRLAKDLKTIASLIFSDINTKVYYVSLGSFDTHVNQEEQQKRLFTEFNNAILAFTNDLKANHRFEDVLIMTFSEFGRRVAQNASNGTDHGTANNMFLIGGGLKKSGLLNSMSNLSDLEQGDLKFSIDFKSVYATVLNKWLGANDQHILNGTYQHLDFI